MKSWGMRPWIAAGVVGVGLVMALGYWLAAFVVDTPVMAPWKAGLLGMVLALGGGAVDFLARRSRAAKRSRQEQRLPTV